MRFGPCLAVAVLAFSCVATKADASPYTITGTGASQFTGSADLTTTDNGDGSYTITDIAGTAGYGLGVTGLIAPGAFTNGNGQSNDNLLFPGSSTELVDTDGFAFTDTLGDTNFQVDVFSTDGTGDYAAYLLDSDGFAEQIPVTLDVTLVQADPVFSIAFKGIPTAPSATPEPSTLALMGTGFLGLAGLVRGRRKRC
ncbi:MAG TPA: PEP-CTERM sorting domain-containing protein [Acidobacteriaceae bacterium]|nr:PEP-CTERM sorting domain-containing protein [Acidobacteriaceae bacterium]